MKDTTMKKIDFAVLVAAFFISNSFGENAFLHLEYQNFDFDGSKQKKHGENYVSHIGFKQEKNLYEAAYTKTETKTLQPPLSDDLSVDKIYLKYTRTINDKQSISISYATISDNIAKETDGGNIYGISYRYNGLKLNQFLSDYRHFNVYQTDIGYTLRYHTESWKFSAAFSGTFIYLQDKDSNTFSAKAQGDYITPSLILHSFYETYHVDMGAYWGKRIFTVMHDGFGIQHHAMEFNRTYMFATGKRIGNLDVTLKYLYMRATEVPIQNPGVEIESFIFSIGYRF